MIDANGSRWLQCDPVERCGDPTLTIAFEVEIENMELRRAAEAPAEAEKQADD